MIFSAVARSTPRTAARDTFAMIASMIAPWRSAWRIGPTVPSAAGAALLQLFLQVAGRIGLEIDRWSRDELCRLAAERTVLEGDHACLGIEAIAIAAPIRAIAIRAGDHDIREGVIVAPVRKGVASIFAGDELVVGLGATARIVQHPEEEIAVLAVIHLRVAHTVVVFVEAGNCAGIALAGGDPAADGAFLRRFEFRGLR